MKKIGIFFTVLFLALGIGAQAAAKKTLVLVAGNSIHLWGDHENLATCKAIKSMLGQNCKNLEVKIVDVADGKGFEKIGKPDALVLIGEGEGNHPLKNCPQLMREWVEAGINIGVFHYSLQFGNPLYYGYLDSAIGGHYEPYKSVGPFWKADFKLNSSHPISRGVKPFSLDDEWYFNIQFTKNPEMKITRVLSAIPPDKIRKRGFGAHSGNPEVRANIGGEETLLWTLETNGGRRGLGFCGGHSIWLFADANYRKCILNSLAWLAGADIPAAGVESIPPDFDWIVNSINKPKRGDFEYYFPQWKSFYEQNSKK